MSIVDFPRRQFLAIIPLLPVLAACQSTGGNRSSAATAARLADVPVSILGLEGVPEAMAPAFEDAVATAATARGLKLVDEKDDPRYRLKAYVSAQQEGSGTVFSYAWDVIGAEGGEPKRVESSQMVNRVSTDPWALADEKTMKAIADNGVDALVRYLAVAT